MSIRISSWQVFSRKFYNALATTSESSPKHKIDVEYAYVGDIPASIKSVKCTEPELQQALKLLDADLSQVARIEMKVGEKTVYIYNHTFSGYKRPSLHRFEDKDWDGVMKFATAPQKGRKRTTGFAQLYTEIKDLLKTAWKTSLTATL